MIKFKHFNYKSDFLNHLENGLIQNDDIVFIKDAQSIYAKETFYAEASSNAVKTITVNGVDITPTNGIVNIGYINKQVSISEESVMTIFPNIYYKNINTALSELTINLSVESDSNILNEYFVEFTIGISNTVISLPSTIK